MKAIDLQKHINQAATLVHEGNTEQAIRAFDNVVNYFLMTSMSFFNK